MKNTSTRALFLSLALTAASQTRAQEDAVPVSDPSSAGILDASFETLARTLDEARGKAGEAIGQRDAALGELAALRQAQEETARLLEGARAEVEAVRQAEAQWKNEAAVLAEKLSAGEEAYAQLGEFRSQMKEALGDLAAIKTDFAGVRAELEAPAERAALRQDNEDLKSRAAAMEEEFKVTSQALASEQTEREQLGNRFRDASAENEQLKQRLAEEANRYEALAAEHLAMGERTAALEAESARMTQLMTEAAAQIGGMTAATAEMEQELAAARRTLEEANGMIGTLRAESDALRQHVEAKSVELEAARQLAEAEKAARSAAEGQQLQAVHEVGEMGGKLQAAEQVATVTRQELEAQTARVAELETRIQEQAAVGESEEETESAD